MIFGDNDQSFKTFTANFPALFQSPKGLRKVNKRCRKEAKKNTGTPQE